MADDAKTFMVEGANIIFRNFSGKEGPFNAAGDRNFCVILDREVGLQMEKDGWNVKYLDAREEGEADVPYIQVRVGFKNRPPRIVVLTSTSRQSFSEDMVESLDWADIQNADLICRGYEWDVQGKKGIKAYLQSLFVTIEEDALEQKYAVNQPEET